MTVGKKQRISLSGHLCSKDSVLHIVTLNEHQWKESINLSWFLLSLFMISKSGDSQSGKIKKQQRGLFGKTQIWRQNRKKSLCDTVSFLVWTATVAGDQSDGSRYVKMSITNWGTLTLHSLNFIFLINSIQLLSNTRM